MALKQLFGGRGGGVSNPAVSTDKTTTSGTGVKPNSTVTVYKNGTQAGTATANGSGAWSYTFGSALAAGDIVTYDAILTSPAYTVPGSSKITLPYDPVLIIFGDSQGEGKPTDAEIASYGASYMPTSKVQSLNFAGNLVNYNPGGGYAGISPYSGDSNHPGMEIGFIRKFTQKYNNTLYILKMGAGGSFQTRGQSTGTLVGSMSGGNVMTTTSGSSLDNSYITGSGIPDSSYIIFPAGDATHYYVGKLGQAAHVDYTFPSTTITTYNAVGSWSITEGGLYLGTGDSITSQMRGRFAGALAAMASAGKSPRIVSVLPVLGTNDMAYSDNAAAFQAAQSAFFARLAVDFDLSHATLVLPRVGTGAPYSDTVRAAQAANVAADAGHRALIDMDGQTRWDNTHWNLAGLDYAGAAAFDASGL